MPINLCFQLVSLFPASRGLSRRDKLKRQERDLCRLPTSFLSRMTSRFLNNQWRFCHVWHNPENRFEFERERERLLNLSARSNFKWTNQSWRWNNLAAVVVDPITSLWGKPKRKILRQIFRSLRAFRPAKHTYLERNLLGFMELLVLLRFRAFLFEEKALCGVTSGHRWIEWFPC